MTEEIKQQTYISSEDEQSLLQTIDNQVREIVLGITHDHAKNMDAWAKDVSDNFQTNARAIAKETTHPQGFYIINSLLNGIFVGVSMALALHFLK
jgi:hypothetical protein